MADPVAKCRLFVANAAFCHLYLHLLRFPGNSIIHTKKRLQYPNNTYFNISLGSSATVFPSFYPKAGIYNPSIVKGLPL